ncbi:MAG TPA: PLP-dependent aminotransferase family protein, partial [Myxococcales bacterium]|nr:PLP-dependent aminotransferase family protein [Myxococcales bacterium]
MTELARRMARVQASAIREILKVTERPDVLSFAGGLPAPEAFPVEALARAHAEVLSGEGAASALQYGPTEGFTPLRAWVAERMTRRGLAATTEQVLITAGSQQGIDLVAKALIDEDDLVLVEAPSYLAALQTFSTYEARIHPVETDEEGMRVDALERVLKDLRPKLVYLVPNFQNPRGTTLGLARRLGIARLVAEHGVTLLEDDPYCELRYRGAALPPIAGLEPAAKVIHLGTFSKTL